MRNWKFNHIDFSTFPFYGGNDLGVHYFDQSLYVKIWAPTAHKIEFRLYDKSERGNLLRLDELQDAGNGTWKLEIKGDFEGLYYTFRVFDGEWLNEVPDMYAKAVGVNGKRGLIFTKDSVQPEGWGEDQRIGCQNPVDAVIYELHVRDFSVAAKGNFRNKGKYLAFTEENLVNQQGHKIGLDHLVEMGITHVHLLPVNDFLSVDEKDPMGKYNWGYDPLHYFAPEGSYASNPDTVARIKELKQLVQALHSNGIGVIFDVVYNHTGFTKRSVFNQTVPGYFYRQKQSGAFSNASGCGNEIASERAMVRKYIVDSLKYWANEFHADGFRFDLMGILDIETMNQIREELDAIDPNIVLYGEGWTADKSPLDEKYRAIKMNVSKLKRIAVFNDEMRDAIKGNNFDWRSKGFVSGQTLREEQLKFGMVAACFHPEIIYHYVETSNGPWAMEPWQCVNYVSCHDNYTLYDKLLMSSVDAGEEELKQMIKLAGAIVLTSQGIPFLHAGSEFARTKSGDHNSYKSPDLINQIDWERKSHFADVVEYYKTLIELRKRHPAFRLRTADQIRHHVKFSKHYQPGVISYSIIENANGDSWKEILMVFNGNKYEIEYPLQGKRKWSIVAKGATIDLAAVHKHSGEKITVPAISMLMLVGE